MKLNKLRVQPRSNLLYFTNLDLSLSPVADFGSASVLNGTLRVLLEKNKSFFSQLSNKEQVNSTPGTPTKAYQSLIKTVT